ncbi:hypothetical protein FEM33_02780 [Dyadobacter flavalbus]|uniref:DUF642 domain-containing protein n=1 Tax=Dyadobacter flavalbus TaxID=2579942 RepID=A0A5M8R0V6_9BACT|nr:hypothetical protein [Dyadobacter flavalbus]KAA6441251.1 hypothetical protein FEM33_02780 [Dyadobacter flavalbus]
MVKITKSLSFVASAACLSTMLFMSSCSKEDAVTPSKEMAVTNESSNLKINPNGRGNGLSSIYVASTNGPTCIGCAPIGWSLKIPSRDATSSLIAYAGSPLKNWVLPLDAPQAGSAGSIITVVNDAVYTGEAFTSIHNLEKGKKYKLTFIVSTTSLNEVGGSSPYAEKATVSLKYYPPHENYPSVIKKTVDFTNKKAQWVTESIEFVAEDTQYSLSFQGSSAKGETRLTYANIHVGSNAVEVLN